MGFPRTTDNIPLSAPPVDWYLSQAKFLRTDDGSAALNVDGSPPPTSVVMWNGTGVDDTGGDWAEDPLTNGSESASAMHSGTNGWDTGVLGNDGLVVWDNGSLLDVDGTYATISFWLNPQVFPSNAEPKVYWLKANDSKNGSELLLEDYVTNFDLGVWQKVTIPIADFNLSENVQKFAIKHHNSGQRLYYDDFELAESIGGDGPFVFQFAAPDALMRCHLSMLVLILSGASSGWDSDTFANITALANGLLLRQRNLTTSEVKWSMNCKDNVDLFGRYHPQDDITFADGTLLMGFMLKPGKASIVVTDQDVLEFVVRDDLSGLDSARAFAHFAVEVEES